MRALVLVSLLAVLATGCSGVNTVNGVSSPPAPAASPSSDEGSTKGSTAQPPTVIPFGQNVSYDGLDVSVGEPQTFKPRRFAVGFNKGDTPVVVKIAIRNTGSEKFDPTLIYVTASANGRECHKVYDTDANIGGGPQTNVIPGRGAEWKAGFSCPAHSGSDFIVDVTPGFMYDTATYEGVLP